jgi:hypothetical protein
MTNTCATCRHWRGLRDANPDLPHVAPDAEWRIGECDRLNRTLDIDISAGWNGGTVRRINTPISFGCVLHEV